MATATGSSVAEAEMEAFLQRHQAQLAGAQVPQHLWPIVYYKLKCVAPSYTPCKPRYSQTDT